RWITYVRDHYTLSWFFSEHVDHRFVVPKIVLALDHLLFRGRGWFAILCTFCLQAMSGFLLWRLSRRAYPQSRTDSILLAAMIGSCVFSAQQWINFIWPFQVQFPMVYCFAAAALVAMLKSSRQAWSFSWIAASLA